VSLSSASAFTDLQPVGIHYLARGAGSQLACIECRSAELIDALRREVGSEPAREPASEPRWEPGIEPEVGRLPDMAAVAGLSAHSDAYSLGAAYVFEGSAMGAAILKKKIDVAGLPLPRYLSLLTQSSASRWPRFAKTLDVHMETTQQYLGIAATDLLGQPMDSLLDELLMHSARNMLTRASSSHQRHVVGERVFGNTMFQVSVYGKDGRAVLDFLPYPTATRTDSSALERARVLLTESTAHDSVEDVLAAAVESLRTTTRFDRVKAYRFLPDNSGEVVAESRASHMESYMGLRFPATDIPPVARELYVKTPIRVMADVHASDATLLALDPDARPLDLSLSILRGSSGVHVQYLKNMGVKSTLTLPIVVEGKLWGLFSLHHNKPLVPEPTALIAAELTGKMLGLILQHAKHTRHLRRLSQSISFAHELFSANVGAPFENSHTSSPLPSLSDLIQVDGLAVVGAGKVYSDGTVPSVDACQAIVGLASRSSDQLFLADDLRAQLPDTHLGDSAGVLRMNVDARKKVSLLLFRGLSVRQTSWAGVPQKSLTRSALGPQLNPRKSFASYVESVEGKCDEWSNDDLEVAVALQSALIQVFSVQSELKDGRDRANLLVHELNHRVRNILTLVQSLSSSSRASATSLEGYATSLEERIAALATAHDLLTDGDLRGVSFARMARVELHPFIQGEDEDEGARAELQGPEISLKPDAAQVMALVLHELTSNSVKYGSLSVPQGRVSLVWEKSDRGVIISWSESGGPHVTTPEREEHPLRLPADTVRRVPKSARALRRPC